MKLILTLLLILIAVSEATPLVNCGCTKAEPTDKTIWGHMARDYSLQTPRQSIQGKVLDPRGDPVYGALVEVFADDGTDRTPTSQKRQRVMACKVGENGRFCFKGLRPGKYILAIGSNGFNISFISVVLDPKNPTSSNKSIKINLELGT